MEAGSIIIKKLLGFNASTLLLNYNLIPMVIELGKGKNLYLFHKVSPIAIALSIRHLSTMLKSGLPIDDALDVLLNQLEDKKLLEVYTQVLSDVRSGTTLADSMKKHPEVFSEVIISLIQVGEEAGTLEKNLNFLTDYLKKNYELGRKINGATTYPVIIIFFTMIEMLGVVYFILPKIESVFAGLAEMPAFTRFVLDLAAFIRANGQYILLVLFIFYVIFSRFMASKLGKKIKDRLGLVTPVFKEINKKTILATFARTLGILLESGVPLQKAMLIAQNTIGNEVYAKALSKIAEDVKSGKNLADSLSGYPKLFPVTYVKMIETGEKTAGLEENLNYLYDFYTDEVIDMTNNLTTLLEPLLLIFVGAMIGGLALLIITPIYQLTGSINV